jgi:SAM-dependent methyltransferase
LSAGVRVAPLHPIPDLGAAGSDRLADVGFFSSADAYDRFMGRYSAILSPRFADLAGVTAGMEVLDVGCGPGVLTGELVERVGAGNVAAIDPSPEFVDAVRERHPDVEARIGVAEELPYPDDVFDAALSQLVVHFMSDPVAGLRNMARVTRPGGVVAACVWDLAGGRAPISPFWRAVREVSPGVEGESDRRGGSEADLAALFEEAGLANAVTTELVSHAEHTSFDEWWRPFMLGVGPASVYLAKQDHATQEAIHDRCRALLGDAPTVDWRAWAARAVVP